MWSDRPNAISKEKAPETLVIPCFVKRRPVKIIGNSSFAECRNIQYIIIQARVTEIQGTAFCDLPLLKSINIPNTCTSIGNHAIQCHDTTTNRGSGTLSVLIERGSSLRTLALQAMSYKQFINVYTCESISPQSEGMFYLAEEVHIYSPVTFTFNYKDASGVAESKTSESYNEMHCYSQPGCILPKQITCKTRSNSKLFVLLLQVYIS